MTLFREDKTDVPLFPRLTSQDILDCQMSSWYPKFSSVSIKTTIIKPLPSNFVEYLQTDRVFAPKGSEEQDDDSGNEDDEDTGSEEDETSNFAFPELDTQIRRVLQEYGAVFPKMNWSSPKDAQWILSTTEFMRCLSPADVYLSLKASDFIQHDINAASAFEGINDTEAESQPFEVELSLRKWYSFDRSRELRCFVREGVLIGVSQREMIYYDFWTPETQQSVANAVQSFWEKEVRDKWKQGGSYVFDVLLTRDLQKAHLVDFNPFATKTDPLLFTYEELQKFFEASQSPPYSFEFRVIDSPSHPHANINAPRYQHNMVPLDALALSKGRDIQDFANVLADAVQESNANPG